MKPLADRACMEFLSASPRCDGSRSLPENSAASCSPFSLVFVLVLLLGFPTIPLCADDLSAAFDQANKLYEQGKYSDAAAAYQNVIQAGKVSASLYFNLGNALFKSGQIGQAIIGYRLAERLAPRDPDIKANLYFARDSLQGGSAGPRSRWRMFLNALTLNELTLLSGASLWIWMTLLTLGQVQRDFREWFSGYTATAGVVSLVLGVWLGLSAYTRLEEEWAVVVVPEVAVRYGPLEESQSFYTLRDGAELTVLDRKDSWLQVKDASRRAGWVRSKDVVVLPPG